MAQTTPKKAEILGQNSLTRLKGMQSRGHVSPGNVMMMENALNWQKDFATK